jgi:hypothetical protein
MSRQKYLNIVSAIQRLGEGHVYYPTLAIAFGSIQAAILLSQFIFRSSQKSKIAGWFYKSRETITIETGLTRREQEQARKLLKHHGILEEKIAGRPPTVHYKVDYKKANVFLNERIPDGFIPREEKAKALINVSKYRSEARKIISKKRNEEQPRKKNGKFVCSTEF